MPVLTLTAQGPNFQVGLFSSGPLVAVQLIAPEFVVPQPEAMETPDVAEPVPTPTILNGLALIDTGASHTSIDTAAATTLGLKATGSLPTMSASQHYEAKQYAVGWKLTGYFPEFQLLGVSEAPNLAPQNLIMLIGRDILGGCVMVYNGPSGTYTLTW